MDEDTILQCPSPSAFILDDDLLAKISLHIKPRKRVSFYDDENLVRIREIPPRGDSPLSEELEECDPETLQDEFENISLGSMIGSYEVGKSGSKGADIVSQITGLSNPFAKPIRYKSYGPKRSYGTPGTVIKTNPTPAKTNSTRRTRRTHKDGDKQRTTKKSSSQATSSMLKQRERVSSAKKPTAKDRVPNASKPRTKSPNPETSGVRPSTPKSRTELSLRDSKPGIPSTAAFQETTNSLISELPWLTLPRIHHSPYRQAATPPPPGKGTPSPTTFSLHHEGSQTSISSLDFKTLSPRVDHCNGRISIRRESGTVRSNHRMYAWQVANGMTSATPVITPCISQLWDVNKSPVDSKQPS
ncbi:uncharacterized protein LOC135487097 [Lineus longissimus]|uniref:uncharacterized protein LOC135487097 n=1 Tax=Lineus longissimus TaxID=88925 RepID=UPI00315D2E87